MRKLTQDQLLPLERYAEMRPAFRVEVMAHKKNRQLDVGPHARLYFEDAVTIRYQVQEMLRAERIFEADGIREEIDTYNPLIPDGSNWKATFMIEYRDAEERRAALAQMIGIEDHLWVQVAGHERVLAIADEDLPRENSDKTSSVHFVRFELNPAMVRDVKAGAAVEAGIDHPAYRESVTLGPAVRDALAADLD